MRTSVLVVGLIVLNAVLAVAIFAPPQEKQPATDLWGDCCKGNGPETYCCQDCCFLGSGCDGCVLR